MRDKEHVRVSSLFFPDYQWDYYERLFSFLINAFLPGYKCLMLVLSKHCSDILLFFVLQRKNHRITFFFFS